MILVFGALIIFGILLTSSNRLLIGNAKIADENEYYISALSVAQAVLDEAKTKAFDQRTVNKLQLIPDSLTASSLLGREAGEAIPFPDTLSSQSPFSPISRGYRSMVAFNDIDDYNGYRRLVNTPRAEGYQIFVTVSYAGETNPDSVKFIKTFSKKMDISITSPYFAQREESGTMVADTIKLSYAFTY
ncbi:MAG: hypothetical protein QME52_01985 [Bacteroidota bacterium]|nr:hypothetical protein [Bacteroidota bacterium]